MRKWILLLVVMMVFTSGGAYAGNPDAIVGDWYTAEASSVVQVYKCGEQYCGRITWLKNPRNEQGGDKLDIKNPDEKLKSRRILGLEILRGFAYKDEYSWEGGSIYDPKNGKTYSCKMRLEGSELKVRGYVGFSLLGRTTVWTKKT